MTQWRLFSAGPVRKLFLFVSFKPCIGCVCGRRSALAISDPISCLPFTSARLATPPPWCCMLRRVYG